MIFAPLVYGVFIIIAVAMIIKEKRVSRRSLRLICPAIFIGLVIECMALLIKFFILLRMGAEWESILDILEDDINDSPYFDESFKEGMITVFEGTRCW